jgi:tetratricopeptide (TPR) repeat protein
VFLSLLGLLGGCGPIGGSKVAPPQGASDYVRGLKAAREGQSDRAITILNGAVRENPELTMARAVLGDLYYDKGQTQQAAGQYEALTRLDPYNPDNFYKLGLSYQVLNRLKEAAASYLRALHLDPDNLKANMNLGLVYLALNQPADAAKYLEKATTLDGQSAVAFANYGVALDAEGQYAAAEKAYRRSIELDGEQGTTLLNLGSNLILQGRPGEAATALRQAIAKTDSPLARKRLGDALALGKKLDEALEQYHQALTQNPKYYPAMNEIGRVLVMQYKAGLELDDRKLAEALAMWHESLQINANQPPVQALLKQWDKKSLFTK